jgi:hypothetical protein
MSLVAQLNAALKRRLEANLIIAGEIVATEVRRQYPNMRQEAVKHIND